MLTGRDLRDLQPKRSYLNAGRKARYVLQRVQGGWAVRDAKAEGLDPVFVELTATREEAEARLARWNREAG